MDNQSLSHSICNEISEISNLWEVKGRYRRKFVGLRGG